MLDTNVLSLLGTLSDLDRNYQPCCEIRIVKEWCSFMVQTNFVTKTTKNPGNSDGLVWIL